MAGIFAEFIPLLMLNCAGLLILLHPNTGRPPDDHVRFSFWFTEVLAINGESLLEISNEALEMEKNTKPVI